MNDNEEFAQATQRQVRRMVAATSAQTRARLQRIVDEALRAQRPSPRFTRRKMWPAAALAGTLLVLAGAVVTTLRHDASLPEARTAGSPADDVALLLNVENLDLLEQMEFYLWLVGQPGLLDGEGGTAPGLPQRS